MTAILSPLAGRSDPAHRAPEPLPADFLDRLRAGASRRDAGRILPFDIIDEMKARRFGARRLPVALGGAGISTSRLLSEVIDLAAADPNVAHIWRNHFCILERLVVHGPRTAFLSRLAADIAAGKLVSLAGTELTRAQTGGASPFSATLLARDDELVMNGRKFYSTGVIYADHIQSAAIDADGANVSFVVPRDREGIEILDDWTGMGQRLTGTGTTIFTDTPVLEEEVLHPGCAPKHALALSSSVAQLVLTGVIAGIVEEISREAVELLRSRSRTFYFAPTELAAEDPILLQSLGEREADAFATRAVVLAAAAAIDRASEAISADAPDGEQDALAQEAAAAAARAKIVTDRIAHAAGAAIYDVAGASSTLSEKNLDRHWRNLRTISSHNPASYKAFALGNRRLNGAELPRIGFF